MDFLSALATALTIETGFISNIREIQSIKSEKKFQKLKVDIDYEKIAADIMEYAGAADEYIAKRHHNMTDTKIVTDEDRLRFVKEFYSSHSDFRVYRESLDVYLNSYLDEINGLLSGMMSAGEKFINKKVSDILSLAEISAENTAALKADVQELRKDVKNIKEKLNSTQNCLDDVPTFIDKNYIDEHKVDDSQLERCRFEYYNAGTSAESIFKAVINGLSVVTDEYIEISRSIYETVKMSSVLFLIADGGTGKSTLLCDVAVRAVQDGCKVYFADGRVNVNAVDSDEIKEETFFLLDNVLSNPDLLVKLYTISEKKRYVHVVLSDRSHNINALIGELDIPGWIINGKAIILKNGMHSIFHTSLRKTNVKEIMLSKKLRKAMSDEAIASTIAYEELNEEIAEKVQKQLLCTNRSVTDIVLDFCVKYNAAANADVRPIRRFRWDWDIWDEIPELKGNFRYLAALNCYGVNVSVLQMEKIAGHSLDIGKIVKEGKLPVIRVNNYGIIKLRHDTVADNYFKTNHIRAVDVIEELFEGRKLNDKTVVDFERAAFSLSNIFNASGEIRQLHIPELITAFNRIDEYRKILTEHQRIHSLEFATIGIRAGGVREKGEYYRKQIGRSYEAVYQSYSNQISLWIKYFFFTVNHADAIPIEMLLPLQTVPGLYKKVTKTIDDYIRRAYRSFTDEEKEMWLVHTEELFNWIINNINRNDVPSRILLLWIYQHSGKIEKAKDIVSELSGLEEFATRTLEFSIAYIQTCEGEVRQLVKLNRNDPKIGKTNRFIREYYKNLLEHTDKSTEEYITVVRSYVRFQKNSGHFDEAYRTALETLEYMADNHPEISVDKLYIELGMICRDRNHRNKSFNLNEAINWFQKAIEKIEEPSSRKLLYALKPLCKSYLVTGQTEECIKICNWIRKIDPRDREVVNLRYESIRLQRIREMQLPKGAPYRYERRLEPEELEYEFNRLINEMTEEQLAFAELFGLKEDFKKSKGGTYRVAFSIRNNTYIPQKILLKLKITDTSVVERLIGEEYILLGGNYESGTTL